MTDNYAKIVRNNLEKLFAEETTDLGENLAAVKEHDSFLFRAFGKNCRLSSEGIFLDGEKESGVLGILISLYALGANPAPLIEQPFKAFKEFPDSMPYVGAFATRTELILTTAVSPIKNRREEIIRRIGGKPSVEGLPGDFTVVLFPLPKIALCYIFYEADEDFPAAATCLYSNNASLFMPVDGLADVGEYTSKRIIEIIEEAPLCPNAEKKY